MSDVERTRDGSDKSQSIQQKRQDVYAVLHHAASFQCLVEEWRGREELEPKPNIAPSGVRPHSHTVA